MDRRIFIGKAFATGLVGALAPGSIGWPATSRMGRPRMSSVVADKLRGVYSICYKQLVHQYFPFWEKGGNDRENGGIMCYLYPDGSVQDDRKDIWYQGRGIWVYANFFNHLESYSDRHILLSRARATRRFMVDHMHNGDGTWKTTVDRSGKPVDSIAISRSENVYGALFAAAGLLQLAKATGSEEDLELARLSLRKSVERYENSTYRGVTAPGVEATGLRSQGHTFMMIWVIPQLLELDNDPWFAAIFEEHLDALQNNFWNPEFGISNEVLFHDYSRIPSQAGFMVPGHSIEAQWMGMREAVRLNDLPRDGIFRDRMRRLIEMTWDHVFDGTCDTGYHVFAADGHPAGPVLDEKTMWAQAEVCIGTMLAYQQTREAWALDWFERSWNFLQRTMITEHGVWRQAVDRRGRDKQRDGISIYRQGNFHQPRCLMYLMKSIKGILEGNDAIV